MYKKLAPLLLLTLLVHSLTTMPASAGTDAKKRIKLEEKVKAGIVKLGAGRDSRVAVKLRDDTKLSGYVSRVEEGHFVVTDLKTGKDTPVAYATVAQVKGNNLTTGAKIAIGIGIGVGVTLLVLYLIFRNFD